MIMSIKSGLYHKVAYCYFLCPYLLQDDCKTNNRMTWTINWIADYQPVPVVSGSSIYNYISTCHHASYKSVFCVTFFLLFLASSNRDIVDMLQIGFYFSVASNVSCST